MADQHFGASFESLQHCHARMLSNVTLHVHSNIAFLISVCSGTFVQGAKAGSMKKLAIDVPVADESAAGVSSDVKMWHAPCAFGLTYSSWF